MIKPVKLKYSAKAGYVLNADDGSRFCETKTLADENDASSAIATIDARAKEVVRRWNSHQSLVDALISARAQLLSYGVDTNSMADLEEIDAALKKAGVKS